MECRKSLNEYCFCEKCSYVSSEPEYIGAFPIRQDLEILPAATGEPVKGWTVKEWVSIDGNKYLRLLAKYLKKVGKESEDDLTQAEIKALYKKCEF